MVSVGTHSSVVVPEGGAEGVRKVMEETFKRMIGVAGLVRTKG